MFMKKKFALTLLLIMISGFWLMGFTSAVTSNGLPPRPTGTPASTPIEPAIEGGFIQLQVSDVAAAGWTAVQWQDNAKNWHTVDGWQGTLEANGQMSWYVGPENLGRGPFRWLIFDAPEGKLLLKSDSFFLPDHALETTIVLANQ